MALDESAVLVGLAENEGLWLAPEGTTMPSDWAETLDPAFAPVGYIHEDGPTIGNDTSSEDLFVWQSLAPIRSIVTERTFSLEFTMVETSPTSLATYLDTTVPTGDIAAGFSVPIPEQPQGVTYACVVGVKDGSTQIRFCWNRVTLSEAGEVSVTNDGLLGYPVTLKVLSSPNDVWHVGPEAVPPVAVGAKAQAGVK